MRKIYVLLIFAFFGVSFLSAYAEEADDSQLLGVLSDSDWLPEPEVCPADFLPRTGTMTVEMKADCSVDPVQCVELCKEGWAAGCYFVASKYQFRKGFSGYARSLFLQSCKGGINSGCTNAAVKFERPTMSAEEIHDCENLTYEPMCQDGDYWACMMLAANAHKGLGMQRNLNQAIALYNAACILARNDAICDIARSYIEQLESIKKREDDDAI